MTVERSDIGSSLYITDIIIVSMNEQGDLGSRWSCKHGPDAIKRSRGGEKTDTRVDELQC